MIWTVLLSVLIVFVGTVFNWWWESRNSSKNSKDQLDKGFKSSHRRGKKSRLSRRGSGSSGEAAAAPAAAGAAGAAAAGAGAGAGAGEAGARAGGGSQASLRLDGISVEAAVPGLAGTWALDVYTTWSGELDSSGRPQGFGTWIREAARRDSDSADGSGSSTGSTAAAAGAAGGASSRNALQVDAPKRKAKPGSETIVGKFKRGRPHGNISEWTFPDGTVFSGMARHGIMDGAGRMTFADGSFVDGNFRAGCVDGAGEMKLTTIPRGIFGRINSASSSTSWKNERFQADANSSGMGANSASDQSAIDATGTRDESDRPSSNLESNDVALGLFGIERVNSGGLRKARRRLISLLQPGRLLVHRCADVADILSTAGGKSSKRSGELVILDKVRQWAGSLCVFDERWEARASSVGYSRADVVSYVVMAARVCSYHGQFRRGMFEGKGTLMFWNGTKFTGSVQKSLFAGRGTLTSADQRSAWVGSWSRGRRNGAGVLSDAQFRRYRGMWRDDVRSGGLDLISQPSGSIEEKRKQVESIRQEFEQGTQTAVERDLDIQQEEAALKQMSKSTLRRRRRRRLSVDEHDSEDEHQADAGKNRIRSPRESQSARIALSSRSPRSRKLPKRSSPGHPPAAHPSLLQISVPTDSEHDISSQNVSPEVAVTELIVSESPMASELTEPVHNAPVRAQRTKLLKRRKKKKKSKRNHAKGELQPKAEPQDDLVVQSSLGDGADEPNMVSKDKRAGGSETVVSDASASAAVQDTEPAPQGSKHTIVIEHVEQSVPTVEAQRVHEQFQMRQSSNSSSRVQRRLQHSFRNFVVPSAGEGVGVAPQVPKGQFHPEPMHPPPMMPAYPVPHLNGAASGGGSPSGLNGHDFAPTHAHFRPASMEYANQWHGQAVPMTPPHAQMRPMDGYFAPGRVHLGSQSAPRPQRLFARSDSISSISSLSSAVSTVTQSPRNARVVSRNDNLTRNKRKEAALQDHVVKLRIKQQEMREKKRLHRLQIRQRRAAAAASALHEPGSHTLLANDISPQNAAGDASASNVENGMASGRHSCSYSVSSIPAVPTRHSNVVTASLLQLHNEVLAFAEHAATIDHKFIPYRKHIISCLRRAVKSLWSEEKIALHVFGSCLTGLALPTSDLDILIVGVPEIPSAVFMLAQLLQTKSWASDVNALSSAKIPVIRMVAILGGAGIKMDISFADCATYTPPAAPPSIHEEASGSVSTSAPGAIDGGGGGGGGGAVEDTPKASISHSGLLGAGLVNYYIAKLPALRPLLFVLKQILVEQKLNDTFSGGISSHCLTLMLVAFLRVSASESARSSARTTPSMSRSTSPGPGDHPNGKNRKRNIFVSKPARAAAVAHASFMVHKQDEAGDMSQAEDSEHESSHLGWENNTNINLGQLLTDFLGFYGTGFNPQTTGISATDRGNGVFFELKFALPNSVVILDPFAPWVNLAQGVFGFSRVQAVFQAIHQRLLLRLTQAPSSPSSNGAILVHVIKGDLFIPVPFSV